MKKISQSIYAVMFFLGLIAFSVPALAQDIGSPSPEAIKGLKFTQNFDTCIKINVDLRPCLRYLDFYRFG
jgi:hypothetical protein